jgi:hypothetical protein
MNNRFKRALVLVSLGGMTFAMGLTGWACHPFAQNQPYINFVDDIGQYAVQVGVDEAMATLNNQTLDAWLNDPLTTLYQNIWSGWVQYQYPQDPTYDRLLVN